MAGTGDAHLREASQTVLAAHEVVVEYSVAGGRKVHAVSGVCVDLTEGETLGLVGESGCGKTTLARAILQMPRPVAGTVTFSDSDGNDLDLTQLDREKLRTVRPQLQMIFQDPTSSLNPRRTVRDIVAEPLYIAWTNLTAQPVFAKWLARLGQFNKRFAERTRRILRWVFPIGAVGFACWVVANAADERALENQLLWLHWVAGVLGYPTLIVAGALVTVVVVTGTAWLLLAISYPLVVVVPRCLRVGTKQMRDQAESRVRQVLEVVGINPDDALDRRPWEFSGGQAQRIAIARALTTVPRVIICDEPVSALDVSVKAQIINLLGELKQRMGLTLVFISHDLAVVRNVSDRVAVMYLGKLCEVALPDAMYERPAHPYTELLLSAVPQPDPNLDQSTGSQPQGELPSLLNPPSGCRFRTRCDHALDICTNEEPAIREIEPGRFVACHKPLIGTPS